MVIDKLSNKKMNKIFLLLSIVSLIVFSSCKKKIKGCTDSDSISFEADAEEDDGSCSYAGSGGNITLFAFPKHHGKDTRPYRAYLKFNTQDAPGSNLALYDLTIAADTMQNFIKIDNLKAGKYYIYLTGFDTAINQGVFGGIPLSLNPSSGQLNLDVPVVE